ncbi:MAG: VWA domain-containing protein [Sulfitobacter sp.]|jgi:Ca-activated chloride channel family protein
MSGVEIMVLRPWVLLGLPVLVAVGVWLALRRGGLGDWQKASDPALLRAMVALGRVDDAARRGPLWAVLGAVAVIVVAMSGPAVERRDAVSFRNLDGVLFVVDASESVMADARCAQMLAMGRFGIASLGTRPGGLIVYGGDAYVVSDMTLDHLQLGQTLSLVGPDLVPDAGSRPGRALALAAERLRAAEVLAGDVVVFTDGEGLDADSLRAAGEIAGRGARVSFVALDAVTAAFETHAAAGGGQAFGLGQTDEFAVWIGSSARTRLERQDYPLLFWKDFGRYLLALALVPLLLLFRWQAA